MQFVDKVSIDESTVKRTSDGYLVASSRVSRANNVQLYTGDEMKQPGMEFVRVFRPESEVFSADSMASIAHKPMTNDHPAASVTADTWKLDSIGQMGDEVTRDGEYIRVPLIMMDGTAIKDYEGGKRELSLGYTADVEMVSGLTDSGEAYDAIQRNIRVNHVALVDQGRANQELRIGDSANQWGARPTIRSIDERAPSMTDKLRTVVVDGLSVTITDEGAMAIDKLQKAVVDAQQLTADAKKDMYTVKTENDAMIGKLQAEIDDLKSKAMDDAAIDKRVQDRADLIGKAKLIAPGLITTGLSDADIRKGAVVANLGAEVIIDRSAVYIDTRFEILSEDSVKTTDPLRHIGSVQSNDGAGSWADSTFASAGIKMKGVK
jgi:hypothetical protein